MRAKDILEELSAIDEQLGDCALGRRTRGQARSEIREQMNLIRAEKTIEISLATNEKGGRVYSNAQMREAGITLALNKDETWKELRGRLKQLDDQEFEPGIKEAKLAHRRQLLQTELEFLKNPPREDIDF
jgi:hypothetical protein